MKIECFKSYDIRGVVGETVTEDIFYRIGRATAIVLDSTKVVTGFDARDSSPRLAGAFVAGVCDEGSEVIELGLCGPRRFIFATSHYDADAGAIITASHNPIEYNGMKFVGPGSRPLDLETEFLRIRDIAQN